MISFPNTSIITCVLTLFLIYEQQISIVGAETVSRVCLGCICEAASGCNVTLGCDESVCGPFRITWNYWADAGKPTLDGQSSANENAYARCVNDPYCAGRTVEGYMTKFSQDCNGDGNVNCDDFIRIHRLGGYGCTGFLNSKYEDTYMRCMQAYAN
ncbi:invertebrate-type lysozyme [Xylocopa sonorina]|uniref:invertebrate-type lysozyme n=1 Tax=Xylocopa sonorina TaxID=1818115 RepID=UPI00403AF4CC